MQTHGIAGIAVPHLPGVPAQGTHQPSHGGVSGPAQAAQPTAGTQRIEPGVDPTNAASAPAGVDPLLWSQLTPAERRFYMRAAALGPLTYEPAGRSAAAAPARGGRIDVRV